MKNWETLNDILDFAIEQEQAAADFYTTLSSNMKREPMRELMQSFVEEEMRHKQKLIAIKDRHPTTIVNIQTAPDLKIADYIVDAKPAADMSYEDALVVAMKLEKRAFQLYTNMAIVAEDESIKQSLLTLANEEAKHKLHFEIEYDDMLKEN